MWFKGNLKILGTLLLLLVIAAASLIACLPVTPRVKAQNMMEGIRPQNVTGKKTDEQFTQIMADFSVNLFKKCADAENNCLVSPLSVLLALTMTANGADGDTLAQMEQVVGNGLTIGTLNEYLYALVKGLPNENQAKLGIANSIWFRDDEERLSVEADFLQTNADYYHAEIYKAPFTNETVMDINTWVQEKTAGMINKVLEQIDESSIMYLINAIIFDAKWERIYNKHDIYPHDFTNIEGKKIKSDFMGSEEALYLDDGKAVGFLKPYLGGDYSFMALLPREDLTLAEYINGLTGAGLLKTIAEAQETQVAASLPKFSYEYEIELNDMLKEMGMKDAFGMNANFKRLGQSSRGGIYISEVLHKTFIEVNEAGTKAGAVTKVTVAETAGPLEIKRVTLDRPFIYGIIDETTGLPIFMGSMLELGN